ncbi:MAG TPA: acyltransferase family protein, partial [Acidimicrobiia bacterium]|nr:acyltransferase family protein [Acidimicrobiia bacterium]
MTIWSGALRMAERTTASRNRYVDFLRAASITVVVFGHWLMAAPVFTEQGLEANHLLTRTTWTHYLTWLLQVMPIFFFVGGYANAASWRAARRDAITYGAWLRARLRRLVLPVLPLLMVWTAGTYALLRSGFDPGLLKIASQVALVPVWFLATYVAVATFTPLTLKAWEKWGWASLVVPGLLAALDDLIFLRSGAEWIGYLNYLFVWGTVHSLGYAWADGSLGGVTRRLSASVAGLLATAALVALGPYPVAMVGLDTQGVTNSQPPKITLITLAIFQAGALLALEEPAHRMLARPRVWAATILVNGRIMTLYLWHLTAMVAVIGGSLLLDGWGLRTPVVSAEWWLTRPLWMLVLVLATVPFLLVFGRYERPNPDRRPPPPAWRPLLAVV